MYSGHLGDWYIGLDTQTLLPKALFKFFFQLYSNKKYVELLIGDFAMHVIILKWLKTQKYNKKRKTMRQRGALNSIKTSKSHHVKKKGAPVYYLNTKAAGAMIHSGLSITGMQKFMASLEVPPVSVKTLKNREREIGVTIENVAKKSCLDATELQ